MNLIFLLLDIIFPKLPVPPVIQTLKPFYYIKDLESDKLYLLSNNLNFYLNLLFTF